VVRKLGLLIMLLFGGFVLISSSRPWSSTDESSNAVVTTIQNNNEKANELLQALYDLPLPSSQDELNELNEEFASLDPLFILLWAHRMLITPQNSQHLRHDKTQQNHPLAQVTSFGPTGLVILHLLSRAQVLKDVPVITLDTLHLFKESYAFYDTVRQHSEFVGMELTITKPMNANREFNTRDEFDQAYPGLWKSDPKVYTKITKQNPLERLFKQWEVKMWITGRRKSQGGERTSLEVLEFENYDESSEVNLGSSGSAGPFHLTKGRWKLNPLAFWNYDQVWKYIREHQLPYNVLYDQGYTSLGDEMTTRLPDTSLQNNESFERSGRFVGLNQTECGLHSHRAKINKKKEKAAAAGEEWKVPTLSCEKCIDLDVSTFEEFVKSGESDLLVEFFSPYCGGCQEFAPTLARLAEHLEPSMKVARFDITEHDPPLFGGNKVFEVEATPTLYLVKYSPFRVELYEGEHEYHPVLKWLGK
jgi:phosphoadenosine phosphosulfate reductase